MRSVLLCVAAIFMLSAQRCQESTMPAVLSGEWGGPHMGLVLLGDRATVEYDCAHGTIDEPFRVGGDGRFALRGTHVREHGGPVREGEQAESRPARFTGKVEPGGNRMQVTVTLTDEPSEIGSFTLERGAPPRVMKCL